MSKVGVARPYLVFGERSRPRRYETERAAIEGARKLCLRWNGQKVWVYKGWPKYQPGTFGLGYQKYTEGMELLITFKPKPKEPHG